MGIMSGELQFHIRTNHEQIGKYVILPGDPGRVPLIAAKLDGAEQVACNREYNVFTGYLGGEKVSVCSTGIGGPSAAIAVEELIKCGAHTFVRVGTSGGMDLKVTGGDLVVAQAAIRGDGTSREYLTPDYPAVADFTVTKALAEEAAALSEDTDGRRFHVGVVQSKDSFYGEVEPETMPVGDFLEKRWESYIKSGCLTSEMEAATIFAVALTRRVRAGGVMLAIWNVERSKAGLPDIVTKDTERAIMCAVGAVKRLIAADKK
ncbi:MAG: nucleoside phosphorylase [Oscillospiraceae bacterium]|jgi:uridine phosphorylase|nr:nucleoside phosphorylase [Oscillospiraceae bacterium]